MTPIAWSRPITNLRSEISVKLRNMALGWQAGRHPQFDEAARRSPHFSFNNQILGAKPSRGRSIMPQASVSWLTVSMRINAPVSLFDR